MVLYQLAGIFLAFSVIIRMLWNPIRKHYTYQLYDFFKDAAILCLVIASMFFICAVIATKLLPFLFKITGHA